MPDSRRVACRNVFSALLCANTRNLALEVLDGACQDLRVDPVRLRAAVNHRYDLAFAEVENIGDSAARQVETIRVLTAQRDGLQVACRGLRARLTRQAWAIRELWFGLRDALQGKRRSKDLAVCAHCDAVIGRVVADSHWRTCPKHPAGLELRRLREQLKEAREVLHSLYMAIWRISGPAFKEWVCSGGAVKGRKTVEALESAWQAASVALGRIDRPEE